jgi:hypothetical protein
MMRLFALQRDQLINHRRSPRRDVSGDESGAGPDRPVSQAFPAQSGKKKCDEAMKTNQGSKLWHLNHSS